jgi:glucan phosphoethanolaminetransferase (alkaline phosphatase superfamily)
MNKTLLSILIFAFLLLFIVSPFAGLASLMLVLLIGAFFSLVGNIFKVIIGGDSDSKLQEIIAKKEAHD